MVQRLASMGLVFYTPHQGAHLTLTGERIALRVIRHNRLIEQYLVEALGLSLDKVRVEADRLEHLISDDVAMMWRSESLRDSIESSPYERIVNECVRGVDRTPRTCFAAVSHPRVAPELCGLSWFQHATAIGRP
jgi:hypothetical protein